MALGPSLGRAGSWAASWGTLRALLSPNVGGQQVEGPFSRLSGLSPQPGTVLRQPAPLVFPCLLRPPSLRGHLLWGFL